MKDCDFAYPTIDKFAPAAANVVAYLRKDPTVDLACAIHCGYVCEGVALSFIPHDHPLMGCPSMSHESMAAELETVANATSGPGMKAINWSLVLQILMTILSTFIKPAP